MSNTALEAQLAGQPAGDPGRDHPDQHRGRPIALQVAAARPGPRRGARAAQLAADDAAARHQAGGIGRGVRLRLTRPRRCVDDRSGPQPKARSSRARPVSEPAAAAITDAARQVRRAVGRERGRHPVRGPVHGGDGAAPLVAGGHPGRHRARPPVRARASDLPSSSAACTSGPFAGITFLWFVAVVRDQVGEREDRFFATVFLGSAILFVALLFVALAVATSPVRRRALPRPPRPDRG